MRERLLLSRKIRMTAVGIKPMNIGVVGCGVISSIYLENCTSYSHLNVVAVADLDPARAKAQAARYNIPRAESVEDLLADPTIELVVNLTIPAAHAEVALAAVRAGKSVYNEKPLCVTREDARQLLKEAREH